MTTRREEFLGELRLGRQLTTTSQVAATGLTILLGLLFVLVGRTTNLVGPWSALASVLAGVVFALTLLNVLELLGGSGERGGTYVLIHETLGGLGAFLAGWSILAGSVAVSAALAQTTADHLVLLIPSVQTPSLYIAAALFITLIVAQLLQILPERSWLWPFMVVLLLALGAELLSTLHRVDLKFYSEVSPPALGSLTRSAAWLTTGYAVFEAILTSRRQIRDPGRDLAKALYVLLIAGTGAFAVVGLLAAGLSPAVASTNTALMRVLMKASFLPGWIMNVVAVSALVLATNGALMMSARQMHVLSREGALPDELRRVRGRFPMPPLLFGVLAVITVPLIVRGPTWWLIDLAASLFLVAMFLLNIAAIYSHRAEPDRRRPFLLPFYPLVPAIAVAGSVVLLWAVPSIGLLSGGAWLLLGLLSYMVYARRRQVDAQEGVVVFGRERRQEEKEDTYRILVPLSPVEERHLLLRLAAALAHQLNGEVIPLQVITMSDPLAIEEGRRIARERNTLFQWSTRLAEDLGVPTYPITRLARSVPEGILDIATEEECDLILMPWTVATPSSGARMGRVLDLVVRRAPCDVAVVAYHAEELNSQTIEELQEPSQSSASWHPGSILVPTAGGPHAPLAVRMALLLAREYDANVSAVYVTRPDASDEEVAQGREYIQQTIGAMQEQAAESPSLNGHGPPLEEIPIEAQVVTADSIVAGIAEAGAESGLVLMGASEESLIDQVLLGNVPEQVARECPTPVVMVKRYRGLPRLWLQRTWDTVFEALPTLSIEEQVEIYKEVRRGARPDIDFFVMIGLSAIIATYGLLQNSGAVIIGAMLVAPLFTPIIGLSLAIVQGDVRLLRLAVESTLKGVLLTVGLALVLTAPSPLHNATPEIMARTQPSLFDLAIALASGAAGAYAIARKDVATALPGVAIAAALVPPISVAGIGLAIGDPDIASGGGLLFTTNLIAITLAGSVALLLLGFRPTRYEEREARLRVGLITTVALLLLITIPLAAVFAQSVRHSQTEQAIRNAVQQQIETLPTVRKADFEFLDHGDEIDVTVTVYAPQSINREVAKDLQAALRGRVERPIRLHLITIPVTEIDMAPR
ncbi:MAG: putative amino acid permease YhdG [Anaerolineales bacterium]|nr:putative amino acid permease YhdG [Anaerolineales bacterium]